MAVKTQHLVLRSIPVAGIATGMERAKQGDCQIPAHLSYPRPMSQRFPRPGAPFGASSASPGLLMALSDEYARGGPNAARRAGRPGNEAGVLVSGNPAAFAGRAFPSSGWPVAEGDPARTARSKPDLPSTRERAALGNCPAVVGWNSFPARQPRG